MSNIQTKELLRWLDETLRPSMFADYCPNGLQVQGTDRVKQIVTGVTASLALVDAAIDIGADTVLVHHGWFWRGEDPTVRGQRRARLARLLAHDINLIAYHLPLDAHPVLGNNAQLARELGWIIDRDSQGAPVTTGTNGLIWWGQPNGDFRLSELSVQIAKKLKREPIVVGEPDRPCRRMAWCTGGAQGLFESAIEAGADVFITGEISEPCAHLARESGVAFISAGHHATERYGVLALGQALQAALEVPVQFIDIDNPA